MHSTQLPGSTTQWRWIAVAVLVAAATAGCRDNPQAGIAGPELSTDFLTNSVQQSVGRNGQFLLSHTALSQDVPEIDERKAKELADALVAQFARYVRDALQKDRGASIDFANLTPCDRAFYAAAAYEAFPRETPAVVRKASGPRWIVPMCSGGTPQVAVGVSAFATDVALRGDHKEFASTGEANFTMQGIPVGTEIPASPEKIAALVAELTGGKIAGVPELQMRPRPFGPALAVWRVPLDRPVVVKHANRTWTSSEMYVGYFTDWKTQLLSPDPMQSRDSAASIDFVMPGRNASSRSTVQMRPRKPELTQLAVVTTGDK